MYILIQLLLLLIVQNQCIEGSVKNTKNHKASRNIKFKQTQNKHTPTLQFVEKAATLTSVMIHGERFLQVPEKLVGYKLQKYFTQESSAVVAMSCCAHIQVHRRCLRDMFHAKEHQCSDACPGCCKMVTRQIFAQSRPNYLVAEKRKIFCDYCHDVLNTHQELKK